MVKRKRVESPANGSDRTDDRGDSHADAQDHGREDDHDDRDQRDGQDPDENDDADAFADAAARFERAFLSDARGRAAHDTSWQDALDAQAAEAAAAIADGGARTDALVDDEAADYPDWGLADEQRYELRGGAPAPMQFVTTLAQAAEPPVVADANGTAPPRRVPAVRAIHRSWAAFLAAKRAYERRTRARLVTASAVSAAQRNEQLPSAEPVPLHVLTWQRVFVCAHGACPFTFTAEATRLRCGQWVVLIQRGRFYHTHGVDDGGVRSEEQTTDRLQSLAAQIVDEFSRLAPNVADQELQVLTSYVAHLKRLRAVVGTVRPVTTPTSPSAPATVTPPLSGTPTVATGAHAAATRRLSQEDVAIDPMTVPVTKRPLSTDVESSSGRETATAINTCGPAEDAAALKGKTARRSVANDLRNASVSQPSKPRSQRRPLVAPNVRILSERAPRIRVRGDTATPRQSKRLRAEAAQSSTTAGEDVAHHDSPKARRVTPTASDDHPRAPTMTAVTSTQPSPSPVAPTLVASQPTGGPETTLPPQRRATRLSLDTARNDAPAPPPTTATAVESKRRSPRTNQPPTAEQTVVSTTALTETTRRSPRSAHASPAHQKVVAVTPPSDSQASSRVHSLPKWKGATIVHSPNTTALRTPSQPQVKASAPSRTAVDPSGTPQKAPKPVKQKAVSTSPSKPRGLMLAWLSPAHNGKATAAKSKANVDTTTTTTTAKTKAVSVPQAQANSPPPTKLLRVASVRRAKGATSDPSLLQVVIPRVSPATMGLAPPATGEKDDVEEEENSWDVVLVRRTAPIVSAVPEKAP